MITGDLGMTCELFGSAKFLLATRLADDMFESQCRNGSEGRIGPLMHEIHVNTFNL